MLHFKGISYLFFQYKYLLKEGTGGVGYALGHSLPQDWQYLVPMVFSCHRCDVCPHILLVEFEHQLVLGDLEPPPWHLLIGSRAVCLLDDAMHGFGVLAEMPVYWLCLGLLTFFCTLWPLLRPTDLDLTVWFLTFRMLRPFNTLMLWWPQP